MSKDLDRRMYGSPTAPSATALSPFLNVNPEILKGSSTGSKYIYPEGGQPTGSRFELFCCQIGGAVLGGSMFGSARGIYQGVSDETVKKLQGPAWRTQVLNHVVKHGGTTAQNLGVLALYYAFVSMLLSKVRQDDAWNTLAGTTTAGILYKSPHGLKAVAKGGVLGLSIGSLYLLATSNKFESYYSRR